jgi:peptidoglycan/LPS O-acetylase OafA/YrhL
VVLSRPVRRGVLALHVLVSALWFGLLTEVVFIHPNAPTREVSAAVASVSVLSGLALVNRKMWRLRWVRAKAVMIAVVLAAAGLAALVPAWSLWLRLLGVGLLATALVVAVLRPKFTKKTAPRGKHHRR